MKLNMRFIDAKSGLTTFLARSYEHRPSPRTAGDSYMYVDVCRNDILVRACAVFCSSMLRVLNIYRFSPGGYGYFIYVGRNGNGCDIKEKKYSHHEGYISWILVYLHILQHHFLKAFEINAY